MYIDFKEFLEDVRVWVYQCNRSFTEEEQQQLHARLKEHLNQWTAHRKDLLTSFELRYNRFIIIGADYRAHAISGCSSDTLVCFIQELEEQYQAMLLDRTNVSYRQGEHIAYKNLIDFKRMVKDRAVSAETIVFDSLVDTKLEYEENWEVPLAESWHSRFL